MARYCAKLSQFFPMEDEHRNPVLTNWSFLFTEWEHRKWIGKYLYSSNTVGGDFSRKEIKGLAILFKCYKIHHVINRYTTISLRPTTQCI